MHVKGTKIQNKGTGGVQAVNKGV